MCALFHRGALSFQVSEGRCEDGGKANILLQTFRKRRMVEGLEGKAGNTVSGFDHQTFLYGVALVTNTHASSN